MTNFINFVWLSVNNKIEIFLRNKIKNADYNLKAIKQNLG